MRKLISLILLSLTLNTSCNSAKINSEEPYIQLTKKRCFGKCPVYDLFIYKNGAVHYNGIDNVAKKGKYEFKISSDKLAEIENLFVKSEFTSANVPEEKQVRDLPVTQLKLENKTVLYTGQNIPEKIKNLITILEQLVTKK